MPERRPMSANLRVVLTIAREKAARRRNDMVRLEPIEVLAAAVAKGDPAAKAVPVTPSVLLDCPTVRAWGVVSLIEEFAEPGRTGEVTVAEILLRFMENSTQVQMRLQELNVEPGPIFVALRNLLTVDGEMSLDEFGKDGWLQEINRQFLHPRGIAMSIGFENGVYTGPVTFLDAREDPEGWIFEGDSPERDKATAAHEAYAEHLEYRQGLFKTEDGIQPLR